MRRVQVATRRLYPLRYADEVATQKSAIFWLPEGRTVARFFREAENPDLAN